MHVVEDALGDDGVELGGLLELLQGDPAKALSLGRELVDREDVVAGLDQRVRDAAVRPAPDLEHARRRRREVLVEEVGERGHCDSGPGVAAMIGEAAAMDTISLAQLQRPT
jgi:hypothetical protein